MKYLGSRYPPSLECRWLLLSYLDYRKPVPYIVYAYILVEGSQTLNFRILIDTYLVLLGFEVNPISPVASLTLLLATLFLPDSEKHESAQDVQGVHVDHSPQAVGKDTNGTETNSHLRKATILAQLGI